MRKNNLKAIAQKLCTYVLMGAMVVAYTPVYIPVSEVVYADQVEGSHWTGVYLQGSSAFYNVASLGDIEIDVVLTVNGKVVPEYKYTLNEKEPAKVENLNLYTDGEENVYRWKVLDARTIGDDYKAVIEQGEIDNNSILKFYLASEDVEETPDDFIIQRDGSSSENGGEEGGENGSPKGSFVREGFFRDVDAALCVHPGSDHHELTHEEIACAPIRIAFKGKASHASSAPHEGINALDAMILVFNAIGLLRQQLPQDVRIHGIITKGGDAPNIIPDDTEAKFYVRAATVKRMMDVYHKLERIVEGAAAQTGCTGLLEPTQRNLVENIVPTPSFDAVYQRVLESLGETFEEDKRQPLGSSDVGNVSQVIPVIQPMIRISDVPVAGHSIEKREACRSESGLRSIALGAKALALTALELIEKPEELEQIKADHAEAVKAQL